MPLHNDNKEKLTTNILDDISVRFIINNIEFIDLKPDEYFYILEEAYWFVIDFYNIKSYTLLQFSRIILDHNNIDVNIIEDYGKFKLHRQNVKVFGSLIFSPCLNYVLLVQQAGSNNLAFPKGKRFKNEAGIDCAIRETIEEVGIDISDKIVDISATIFDKITFYCVFNVKMDYPFKTKTRNEILDIFWFDLRKLKYVKERKDYKIFVVAYKSIENEIKKIKNELFHFDLEKIKEAMEKVCV